MYSGRHLVVGLLLSVFAISGARAQDHVLSAAAWSRPRSGEAVLKLPAVRAAVQEWMAHPKQHLVITYAGGESGSLWAAELKDWLVALGVATDHIELRPGGTDPDSVVLSVE